MLEYIISHISQVDVVIALTIAAFAGIYRMNIFRPVIVTVSPEDRLFTVIKNKWINSKFDQLVFYPRWFVSIHAIIRKKPKNSYDPSKFSVDPKTINPNRERMMNYDKCTRINKLYDVIENMSDNTDDVLHQAFRQELEDELAELTCHPDELDDFGEIELTEIEINEKTKKMFDKRLHRSQIRNVYHKQQKANKNPQGDNVAKYKIYFHIPFYISYQLENLIEILTKIHLDKDELLQKVYWDFEERKLRGPI